MSQNLGIRFCSGANARFGALNPLQYSSGSKIQVDERSASVITQSLSTGHFVPSCLERFEP